MGKKVIAITGATGLQGSALIRAILNDGEFLPRAIVKDPSSPKAKELRNLGAEVVQGDFNDSDSLSSAIKGSYGLFCSTFSEKEINAESEKAQGKALSSAAKKSGIEHVIWSAMEEQFMSAIRGKDKTPQHQSEIENFFTECGVPTTVMSTTGFFWESLFRTDKKKRGDNTMELATAMAKGGKMLGLSVDDVGKAALGVFKSPNSKGKRVGLAGEVVDFYQFAGKLGKVFGVELVPKHPQYDVMRKVGIPGADTLQSVQHFFKDLKVELLGEKTQEEKERENPETITFDRWLEKNYPMISVDEIAGDLSDLGINIDLSMFAPKKK